MQIAKNIKGSEMLLKFTQEKKLKIDNMQDWVLINRYLQAEIGGKTLLIEGTLRARTTWQGRSLSALGVADAEHSCRVQ